MKNNRKVSNFSEFDKIYEADLYDNQGIPVEYLRKIKQKSIRNAKENPPEDIMRLVRTLHGMQRGHEDALEKIAIDTIKDQYGDFLDNVEIDAKLVRMGDVINSLRSASEDSNESEQDNSKSEEEEDFDSIFGSEEDPMEYPSIALDMIDPDTLKSEIDKRKISNAIIQGESKNIHRIIHLPEVKEKLDEIDNNFVPIMDRLLKSNEKIEWLIPMQAGAGMMEKNPNGLSKVEWENKPSDEKSEKSAQDILDEIENANDLNDYEDELEDLFDDGSPKIIARAVDFPILLHEITKGIFELIIARAIPADAELAKKVIDNTDTFEDEFDDLRYGVDMRRDLTSYLLKSIEKASNKKSSINKHSSIKEYVFGDLLDTKYVNTKDFLLIMNVIFSEAAGIEVDSAKKRKVDKIIEDVIFGVCDMLDETVEKYEKYLEDLEKWENSQKDEIEEEPDPREVVDMKKELSEVDKLKKDLELAIEEERYEDASEIQAALNDII